MASMSPSVVSVCPWSNPSKSAKEYTPFDADVVEGCTKAYSTRSCSSRLLIWERSDVGLVITRSSLLENMLWDQPPGWCYYASRRPHHYPAFCASPYA